MIGFLFRLLAMVALAVATIMAVLDATRSVAASRLVLTPLRDSWEATLPESFALAGQAVAHYIHPVAWDPVMLTVLSLPGVVLFGALAFGLYAMGRRPESPADRLTAFRR